MPTVDQFLDAPIKQSVDDFLDADTAPLSDQTLQRLRQSAQIDAANKLYRQAQEESKLATIPIMTAIPGAIGALSTPLFHPKTSPEDLAFRERHPIIGGIEKGIVSLAEGFTSPIGVATLGIGALPAQAQRAVAAGFAAQMASQVPEVAGQLGDEFGKPPAQRDTQKIAALITEGVGTLGMVAAAGKKGIAEPIAERAGAIPTFEVPRPLPTIQPAGETYASRVVSPEEIPQLEVRPQVGEETPLRQQGEATGAREPEPRPSPEAEVLPQPEPQTVETSEVNPGDTIEAKSHQITGLAHKGIVTSVRGDEVGMVNEDGAPVLVLKKNIVSVKPAELLPPEEQAAVQAELARTQEEPLPRPAATTAEIPGEKPTPEPTPPPEPAAETPVAKEPWKRTLAEFKAAITPESQSRYGSRFDERARNVHKNTVAAALASGKAVPSEVLADYRDLAKQAATEPEAGRVAARKWLAVIAGSHRQSERLRREIPVDPDAPATSGTPLTLGSKSIAFAVRDTPKNREIIQRLGLRLHKATAERWNKLEAEYGNQPSPETSTTLGVSEGTSEQQSEPVSPPTAGGGELAGRVPTGTSPRQVLSTAASVQINAPEGATYLQITQKGGGVAREPIAKLQKSNTFRGVDIAKVEAGHIGKGGKWTEDTGPLTVRPAMIGMGGAVPEEFRPFQQSPTSIKNERVEQERAERGLPPAIQPARRSFGTVWDEAMAKIDREPDWQDRLIDELRNKPRALTDLEDAAILHRQIDLQNEYAKATRDLAQAYEDSRTADVEELKVRTAGWSDKLLDLYNIGKKVGTETGRGLAARKLMAYEDFSLAKMELDKRAANGGRQLTESEHAEITRLNEKIEELQKRYDDYVSQTEQRRTAPIVDQVLTDAKRSVAKSPKASSELSKLGDTTEKLGEKLRRGELNESSGLIGKLVRAFVEENPDITRDQLVNQVHEVLREFLPEISRRETMDAISGYGDYKPLKKDTISMIVRDLKGQMQQIGKLEDMASGKAPQKTGLERRTPTDEERRLIKLVEEAKRKGGYKITDPATQLRTALQSIKTRLENQIKDLEVQIQTRQKIVKAKTPVTLDSEASRLKARRDELKAQYDEIFPRQPMTDAQRLEAWKKRTQSRIEELQQRLASGDFEKRPMRPPPELDSQAQKLQAELFRAKQEFQRGLIEDRLKNRPWWSRSQDTFLRWYRGGILSSPVVFAKLTAAAVVRAGLTPLEEAVGAGISRVVPKLAARAPREGFWNSTAEANAITSQLTKGPKDAWDVLRTGETDLDVLYGKGREGAIGEMQVRPFSVSDIPGRSHAALKASTKRAEFERSLQKRLAYEIRNGVDASSPAVQLRAAVEAYKDANRAIFLQDNRVVSAYNRALRALEQPSKTTGQVPVGGKAIATVARTLVPIVRVPSNIVAETFQFATGSVTGSARLGRALRTGIDSLPPEQADLIMRELKKGSIGGAALIVGFLLPQVWGGFYQRGEKRQKTDIKAGEARIPGIEVPGVLSGPDVPAFLMHHPLFEAAQAGATVRRISESKWSKRMGGDQKGLPMGLMAASLGLVEETPFVREMEETVKAFNPIEQNAYFGELAKSITEPQLVQWLARQTDKDVTGETVARKPSTFLEHLKMGIPRLRRQVPLKNPVSGPNYFSMSQPTQPSPMGE